MALFGLISSVFFDCMYDDMDESRRACAFTASDRMSGIASKGVSNRAIAY